MVRVDMATVALLMVLGAPTLARADTPTRDVSSPLPLVADDAQRQLQQTFSNLHFENFGPSPIEGPVYQAIAGGRIFYYAPQSEHLVFGEIFDRNGANVTAQAQDAATRLRLSKIDLAKALALGPPDAPTVIEFTDPDCPHCRALERFWLAKAAEGKPVRRLVFFVTGMHPEAAAKAEHILCSADQAVAFAAIYAGSKPGALMTCPQGRTKLAADAALVREMGIAGTPTLIAGGEVISGFRQGELEAFLVSATPKVGPKASESDPP